LAATTYGSTGQAVFGYGGTTVGSLGMTNKVSNTGVVSSDTSGVGSSRATLAACSYGGDKGIFGYGNTGGAGYTAITNLVNNVGTVAADVSGVGTARQSLAACGYSISA
jgi:hypothetical protein